MVTFHQLIFAVFVELLGENEKNRKFSKKISKERLMLQNDGKKILTIFFENSRWCTFKIKINVQRPNIRVIPVVDTNFDPP